MRQQARAGSASAQSERRSAPEPRVVPPSKRAAAAPRPTVRPQVVLYVSSSDESRQAFEVLESEGIDFRAVASRRAEPVATFGGFRFVGVDGMRELATMLHELETLWAEGAAEAMSRLSESPDPVLLRQVEQTRARWRLDARAVLAKVQRTD